MEFLIVVVIIPLHRLKIYLFLQMGALMTESHKSLRDDFEVSCKELDILVDAALKCPGVLGSRMCGGGFGGCTVTLVQKAAVKATIASIGDAYTQSGHAEALVFVCEPSDGARLINIAWVYFELWHNHQRKQKNTKGQLRINRSSVTDGERSRCETQCFSNITQFLFFFVTLPHSESIWYAYIYVIHHDR